MGRRRGVSTILLLAVMVNGMEKGEMGEKEGREEKGVRTNPR